MPSFLFKLAAFFTHEDLWSAAKDGHVEAIRRLVAAGADVNAKNDEGKTGLQIAARHDKTAAIKVLLELGAKVNAKDRERITPLIDATSEGASDATLNALIHAGSQMDVQDSFGFTALSWAARGGHESMVATLLKSGANPNIGKGSRQSEVLGKAIDARNMKIFDMLLAAGAKPAAGESFPALHTAALYGLEDYFKKLLDAGADPNTTDEGSTPAIKCAVRGKNLRVLQMLIKADADLNAQDSAGETALDIARDDKRKEMIALLESKGAKSGKDLPAKKSPENESFWQLPDDSNFTARIDPALKPGSAKLTVTIGCEPELVGRWKIRQRIRRPLETDVSHAFRRRRGRRSI